MMDDDDDVDRQDDAFDDAIFEGAPSVVRGATPLSYSGFDSNNAFNSRVAFVFVQSRLQALSEGLLQPLTLADYGV